MLACLNGRSEVVNILVEAKADINQLSGVSSTVYENITFLKLPSRPILGIILSFLGHLLFKKIIIMLA